MKRDAAATIFRTVVIAGAMLGAPACAKKSANAPKSPPTAPTQSGTGDAQMKPTEAPKGDTQTADEDPCAGGESRPRGTSDEGGETGRGFILS